MKKKGTGYMLTPAGFFMSLEHGLEFEKELLLYMLKCGYNALIWNNDVPEWVFAKVENKKGKK